MSNQTITTIPSAEITDSNQNCPVSQEQRIDELIARKQSDPEVIARDMKRTGQMGRIIANFLLIIEILGLFVVAKATFGGEVIGPFCTATLFVALIAILTKLALSKASGQIKGVVFWGCIFTGGCLAFSGLVGFITLRASTYYGPLMGSAISYDQISLGNALLMMGLTLGLPLILGVLHDDASEKLYRSKLLLEDIEEQKRAAS